MLTHTRLIVLLASPAMTCAAEAAAAQSAPTPTAPGPAQPAVGTPAAASPGKSESIAVTGRNVRTTSPAGGLMRVETAPQAVQTVTRDFIAKQSPTSDA
nr:hypothetical protein [uncultured Lichenicoccus sp.]